MVERRARRHIGLAYRKTPLKADTAGQHGGRTGCPLHHPTFLPGDVMHCDGSVTSQQGWTRDLRCRAGQWYTSRRVDDWQPCPDGSTTAGDQSFRFWRTADDPETFAGYDRTIGPSGGCGVNLWLTVEMPFRLTATT